MVKSFQLLIVKTRIGWISHAEPNLDGPNLRSDVTISAKSLSLQVVQTPSTGGHCNVSCRIACFQASSLAVQRNTADPAPHLLVSGGSGPGARLSALGSKLETPGSSVYGLGFRGCLSEAGPL